MVELLLSAETLCRVLLASVAAASLATLAGIAVTVILKPSD